MFITNTHKHTDLYIIQYIPLCIKIWPKLYLYVARFPGAVSDAILIAFSANRMALLYLPFSS